MICGKRKSLQVYEKWADVRCMARGVCAPLPGLFMVWICKPQAAQISWHFKQNIPPLLRLLPLLRQSPVVSLSLLRGQGPPILAFDWKNKLNFAVSINIWRIKSSKASEVLAYHNYSFVYCKDWFGNNQNLAIKLGLVKIRMYIASEFGWDKRSVRNQSVHDVMQHYYQTDRLD